MRFALVPPLASQQQWAARFAVTVRQFTFTSFDLLCQAACPQRQLLQAAACACAVSCRAIVVIVETQTCDQLTVSANSSQTKR